MPRFRRPSSLVMTHELDISLPAAGMVSMTPMGRHDCGTALPSQKSHTSPSYHTP